MSCSRTPEEHADSPHEETIPASQACAAAHSGGQSAEGASLAKSHDMDINHLNEASLLQHLRTQFRHAPPEGPIVGRTALRDAVAAHLACSQLEAERLVDTLILRGCIAMVRAPGGRAVWEIT